MGDQKSVSRRRFMGGAAAAVGYMGLQPGSALWAQQGPAIARVPRSQEVDEYDALAKLSSNENPYGPSESVLEAMNAVWKYSNRYGYPDGEVREKIAEHHGVTPDHILLGAGSGEILEVVGLTYLAPGKKVVGVDPSYGSVYRHATRIRADAIRIPLLDDHSQNIPAVIQATNRNHREVGFVYLCNPNNPTGMTVPARQVKQVIDGIPDDVPILVDEAYHHFVEDPEYATAVPYVREGRNVIVARTFSKIYGMAGMRLGYAVANPEAVCRMSAYSTGTINALVKWGGAAALQDAEAEAWVRKTTLKLRKQTTAQLGAWGYDVIPSETNFFMVHTGRPTSEVRAAFRKRGVAVGRDFPPMLEHLRVSIGTADEMDRFMVAFKDIFAVTAEAGS